MNAHRDTGPPSFDLKQLSSALGPFNQRDWCSFYKKQVLPRIVPFLCPFVSELSLGASAASHPVPIKDQTRASGRVVRAYNLSTREAGGLYV